MSRNRLDGAQTASLWSVAATLYFLLAATTIHLTSDRMAIATVWPANAVLVSMLLVGPKPRWITVLSAGFVANLLANWITHGSLSGSLLYGLANGLEVIIAVLLVRGDDHRLELLRSTGRMWRFVAGAGLVAPLISGLVGATTAAMIYRQPFGASLSTWMLSDGLGLLVFTPVFVSVFNGKLRECFSGKTPGKRVEALSVFTLTAVIAYAVFFIAALPAMFLLYAPVMLATFRVGPVGTKIAVMLIAVIGACATAAGSGPVTMITADTAVQAQMFQATLAVMLLTCLPVAAEVTARNRLAAELIARERRATEDASTDALTGILNRRGFERAAAETIANSPAGLSCVVIDVDRFKAINDRWGHYFGDRVLSHVASVIRAHIRSEDLAGRLGGDEFILMVRLSDHYSGEAVCERIQAALRAYPIACDSGAAVAVTISCGVAGTRLGDRFDHVYRRADAALYEAKVAGRNTVRAVRSA